MTFSKKRGFTATTSEGFIQPRDKPHVQSLRATLPPRSSRARMCACERSRYSLAAGRGNNPDPWPLLRESNRCSFHHERPAGVAFRRQVSKYGVSPASSESRNVLNHNPMDSFGSVSLADDSDLFGPQSTPLSSKPCSLSGNGNVLTGEASSEDVKVGGHSGPSKAEWEAPNSGKEVNLSKVPEFVPMNLPDVPLVNPTRVKVPVRNSCSEHIAAEGFNVVVVNLVRHLSSSPS